MRVHQPEKLDHLLACGAGVTALVTLGRLLLTRPRWLKTPSEDRGCETGVPSQQIPPFLLIRAGSY